MHRIYFFILLLVLSGCSKKIYATDEGDSRGVATTQFEDQSEAIIELTKEAERPYLGRQATILKLSIIDGELLQRGVTVRATQSDIEPKGALILTTGGFGGAFYGGNAQRIATIEYALANGLQVMEVKWDGREGWATHAEGLGYAMALRGYTRIVEWLKANRIDNPSLVICQGGSGGAMQIAYGLANYNLEAVVDYAILTAGPPTSDLYRAIYGDYNDKARWPKGLLGIDKTDFLLGWEENGDYCKVRGNNPPDSVVERLKAESIVNDSSFKDYNYENTKLYFINTDDITNSDDQGRLYYDRVTSEKDWTYLPGETAHNVSGIEAGATRIREILSELIR